MHVSYSHQSLTQLFSHACTSPKAKFKKKKKKFQTNSFMNFTCPNPVLVTSPELQASGLVLIGLHLSLTLSTPLKLQNLFEAKLGGMVLGWNSFRIVSNI